MQEPLVSVIIPTHNRPDCLLRAVQSVLEQDYQQLEIIVVDDGSEPAAQLPYHDARIRVIRHDKAIGSSTARNRGMKAAQGEFLALLDDDDYYYPHKISRQLAYLQAHPRVDFVFSLVAYIQPDGRHWVYAQDVDPLSNAYCWLLNFKYFNTIHTNSSLFRRTVFERVQFDERIGKYDDMQFHLAVSEQCVVHYVDALVAVWHINARPDQLTYPHPEDACLNYRNFDLICEDFQHVFRQQPLLRKIYYRQLARYAMSCHRWRDTLRALQRAWGWW